MLNKETKQVIGCLSWVAVGLVAYAAYTDWNRAYNLCELGLMYGRDWTWDDSTPWIRDILLPRKIVFTDSWRQEHLFTPGKV